MERPEKQFHLTMHEALLEWKADLEGKHTREMDLLEEKHEREMDLLEGKHQRELQKLRRSLMDTMEDDKAKAVEELSKKDQDEINKLRQQVSLLKNGWKKERQEWQLKKKSLEKDLDPNTSLFNFFS